MNFTLKKSDLNFEVYTVPSKPTAPGAENDIAIISSVPMSNWLMSPEKPSGIPRTDGDVWIQYSTKGDTKNILKQNALMIATISAWQYVDGAWVSREAVSCQGGEWVEWNINVLTSTVDNTGGWVWYNSGSDSTAVKNSDGSYSLTRPTSSASGFLFRTKNSFDLSGVKTLEFQILAHGGSSDNVVGVVQEATHGASHVISGKSITSTGTFRIDVSALSGQHAIAANLSNVNGSLRIANIKLLR